MAIVEDNIPATVDCSYSNIGLEWCAALIGEDGKTLAYGKAHTRADALRNLACAIDDQF